jgi:hypothetical protein
VPAVAVDGAGDGRGPESATVVAAVDGPDDGRWLAGGILLRAVGAGSIESISFGLNLLSNLNGSWPPFICPYLTLGVPMFTIQNGQNVICF